MVATDCPRCKNPTYGNPACPWCEEAPTAQQDTAFEEAYWTGLVAELDARHPMTDEEVEAELYAVEREQERAWGCDRG